MKHCFAISAYEESPYLEQCIRSLKAQSVSSDVILCTSTPNSLISGLSEQYGIPLFVREGKSSLKDDWNFAIRTAAEQRGAGLVTVAHQDDVYHRDYLKALQYALRRFPDISVFCTRYRTVDAEGKPLKTRAESVKRLLRIPLRFHALCALPAVKKLPLIFGNGIGCPTCTYQLAKTGEPVFQNDYHFVIDWETLLRLADGPGRFFCIEKELVDYRVHDGAETKKNIRNHNREAEETEIFRKLWPAPAAAILMHFYKKAYRDYNADTVSDTDK